MASSNGSSWQNFVEFQNLGDKEKTLWSVKVELAGWERRGQRLILDFSTAMEETRNQWVSVLQISSKRYFQPRIWFPVGTSVLHEVDQWHYQRSGSLRLCHSNIHLRQEEAMALETGEPHARLNEKESSAWGPRGWQLLSGSTQNKPASCKKRATEWNGAKEIPGTGRTEGALNVNKQTSKNQTLKSLTSPKAKFVWQWKRNDYSKTAGSVIFMKLQLIWTNKKPN